MSQEKNIFCSMNKEKIRQKRISEMIHCPFEGRAKLHHLCQQNGPVSRCSLGRNSKGQCTISKIVFPLLLYTFIEQNIFFPETYFAYLISEQKFTVWTGYIFSSNKKLWLLEYLSETSDMVRAFLLILLIFAVSRKSFDWDTMLNSFRGSCCIDSLVF